MKTIYQPLDKGTARRAHMGTSFSPDKRGAVEAAGGELAVAKAKLEGARAYHETMKAANKIIRGALKSGSIDDEIKGMLLGLGIEAGEVEKICIPNYFGGYGFESFWLTNSNARIKNAAARVATLERIEANKTSGAPETA